MKKILLSVIAILFSQLSHSQCTGSTLVISAYVEGSSFNKCIEIFNPTGSAIDLSNCQLERYSNGSTTATNIALNGVLGPGFYYLACHSSVDMTELGRPGCEPNLLNSNINHNGDDAYVLRCSGTSQDGIGVVGEDPGSEWFGGGCSTQNASWFKELNDFGSCSTFDPEAVGADYTSYLSTNCNNALIQVGQDNISGLICPGPLKVNWISFTAKSMNNAAIDLSWITSSEENNAYFSIEHSTDGRNFESVDLVDGALNSVEMQYYNYVHKDAVNGNNYYRLRQVDIDGTFSFSPIEVVRLTSGVEVDVRPTLAESVVTITVADAFDNDIEIEVLDILGRTVIAQTLGRGDLQVELPVSDLQKGHYFIRIKNGVESRVARFIKR